MTCAICDGDHDTLNCGVFRKLAPVPPSWEACWPDFKKFLEAIGVFTNDMAEWVKTANGDIAALERKVQDLKDEAETLAEKVNSLEGEVEPPDREAPTLEQMDREIRRLWEGLDNLALNAVRRDDE